jgi:hypothetical protein
MLKPVSNDFCFYSLSSLQGRANSAYARLKERRGGGINN